MKYLRIKDWGKIYENNRTRELKHLDWIPVPNKQDGDGYTLLVDRPDGAEMLGAWLAILQVASKCGVRGTLLRDSATPHDSASLARITRLPKNVFDKVLSVLVEECKWVEYIDDSSNPAQIPHIPAPNCGLVTMEGKGREGKGIENIERAFSETPPMSRDDFDRMADMRGVPKDCAEWFWNTHDSTNWLDGRGNPIRKVEPLLLNALKVWRSNGTKRSPGFPPTQSVVMARDSNYDSRSPEFKKWQEEHPGQIPPIEILEKNSMQ